MSTPVITPILTDALSDADLAAETRAINKIKSVPNPPIAGEKFTMCGVEVTVPPLKVKSLVRFAKVMQTLAGYTNATPQDEAVTTAIPVIQAALSRNYPSLTTDDVLELLDVKILADVTLSIMGRSGYRAVKPGE